MTTVTLKRWALTTVVDEGPSIAQRTFRTRGELVDCVRAEYADLFGPTADMDSAGQFDSGETYWQLVLHGDSGWYGAEVQVEVDVASDGELS